MSIQNEVTSLISGLQRTDPRLYQAISLINKRIEEISQELTPLSPGAGVITEVETDLITSPVNFNIFSTGSTLRFTWDRVLGATSYEIRRGTSWSSASFMLRTFNLQADIDPLVYGTYNFLIKALTSAGAYSSATSSISITIPQIAAPIVSASVIDNNVLLSWNTPTSTFLVVKYGVYQGVNLIGYVDSTFQVVFEGTAGTYTYSVQAVDIAGNVGTAGSVTAVVRQPPDFELLDTFTSALDGTRINVSLEPPDPSNHPTVTPRLIACWATTSYEDHFLNNSWDNIQDQLDAGYPLYLEPSDTTGSYEEKIDFGTILNSVIATASWNQTLIVGSVAVVVKMSVSDDDITYTAFTAGSSQYFTSLRYLKIKLEFTGSNDKSFLTLTNLVIHLDVKRDNDGGQVDALSTDVSGTPVLFNKTFKDIESLTGTVRGTTVPYIVVIDFVDAPDPTGFSVYVFDTTGVRVSKTVDWKARGIV